MKQSLILQQMHKLKFKIPIPPNLTSKSSSSSSTTSTQLSLKLKQNSILNDNPKGQYTDEEVYARINQVCNASDMKSNTIDIPENEFINENSNSSDFNLKINKLLKYFNTNSNSNSNANYLPLDFLKNSNVLTPYDELTKINIQQREEQMRKSDSESNEINNDNEKTRLSVSKIIPFSYCELKNMYQLYIGDVNVENQSMIIGKQIHSDLEIKSHPQIDVKLKSNDGNEKTISIDKLVELQNSDLTLKTLKTQYNSLNALNEQLKNEQLRQQTRLRMDLQQLQQLETQNRLDVEKKLELNNIQDRLKFLKDNYGIIDTGNEDVVHDKALVSSGGDDTEIMKPTKTPLLTESSGTETTPLSRYTLQISTEVESNITKETEPTSITPISDQKTALATELEESSESLDSNVEIDQESENFKPVITLNSTIDPTSTTAYKLSKTITRTLKLLEFGECREVLVHGFYNPQESRMVTDSDELINNFDSNILISGIVDELRLSSVEEDAFLEYKKELKLKLKDVYEFDSIFRIITELSEKWTPMLYLIVNDDKTRKSMRLPTLDQQKSHLLQVGIYKYLLNLLTNDTKFSYVSWRKNLQNRGELNEDIEQNELSNDFLTFICMFNVNFLNDFMNLKNGISIKSIDEIDPNLNKITNTYEFVNNSNNPNLDLLNGRWLIKPTLNHLIIRLAQVQNLIKPFLNDDNLQITYIYQKSNKELQKINQVYDEAYVSNQINLGLDLWLGKRDPYPTNNETTCKYCEFNNKCQIPLKRKGLL